ncbi:MAG: Fis family transcriptional regulator [Gammaproteobacteria bacterium]|nr:MAG: Fis family transcriptional regulator [Gammaproteobacteria bacterium]
MKKCIQKELKKYFNNFDEKGIEPNNVHNLLHQELDKIMIKYILKKTCNNQSKTAKILGISRNTLKTKLNKI